MPLNQICSNSIYLKITPTPHTNRSSSAVVAGRPISSELAGNEE